LARPGDFKLYAAFVEDTRVELSDGAVWMMDKGDVFPIEAYKNLRKSVILRLAGATFVTDTDRIRVLKTDEVPTGLEVYRKNVRAYLDSTSKKMEDKLRDLSGKRAEAKPEEKASADKSSETKVTDEKQPEDKGKGETADKKP
jgi:hypothetical protein